MSLTNGTISVVACSKLFYWEPACGVPMVFTAGCIMALRAYAISEKSKWVLILLLSVLFLEVGVMM